MKKILSVLITFSFLSNSFGQVHSIFVRGGGASSGANTFLKQGIGIKIDSANRVYTVKSDTAFLRTIFSGNSYTLPPASALVLGGIKVGSGLSIDGSNVLSATGGGSTISAFQTFTDASTINFNIATSTNWTGTINGNRNVTISNPVNGATVNIEVIQGTTGNYSLTFPSNFYIPVGFSNGNANQPKLSTAGGADDLLTFIWTGSKYLLTSILNFSNTQ